MFSSKLIKMTPLRITCNILNYRVRFYCTKKSIISSKAKPVHIPKITLQEYLWNSAKKWPEKIAAVCFETNRSYTYSQLFEKSLSLTRFLKYSLKFNKKDTVAVILPNVPEYPIVLLGAIQAGLRVTTCNPNYTADELKKQLSNSQSKLVFTTSNLTSIIKQATDVPIVEIAYQENLTNGTINFEEISTGKTCEPVTDIDINDAIFLPYSSGTTGLPKGVQLSHFNIVSNLRQLTAPEFSIIQQKDDQDIIPAFLPFFHIYGLVVVMLQALVQGAQLIVMPKFSSDNFIKLLKNHKPDVIFCPPPVVLMAINNSEIRTENLIGLRTLMSGAAPLGAADVERFQQKTENKVSIIQGYGMTETSPVTLAQTAKIEKGIKIGGSGYLLPNTDAKIIPLDGSSIENLGPHVSGELVIRGPQNMVGYFNNPQANEEIFLEKEWIKTGDIAHYDEDEHFYVTDRCKELIKVKGFQVAPAEIEEILRSHPSVDDAGVVGILHSILGEAPKAFVVVKSGVSVKPSELEEFVAAKVSKHKHLAGGVVLIDKIPKNPSGKILRRDLKKL